MSGLIERVAAFVRENLLLDDSEHVVVGLSGGIDSIVLTDVLKRLGYALTAVHVNYGLRAEADDEEAFVRAWCQSRDVPLRCLSFDTKTVAEERGLSIQHAARDLRYDAFLDTAEDIGVRRVAVAHHLDDQAETVLLHLFRGTGIEGLAGMAPRRPLSRSSAGRRTDIDAVEPTEENASQVWLVRPLLDVARTEIEAYARSEGLPWKEDPSNVKLSYRRGGLRAEVMPVIERHFGPSVSRRIARTARLVRAYLNATLDPELRAAFEKAAGLERGESFLRLDVLEQLPPAMSRRVIIEAVRRWLPDVEATERLAEEIAALGHAQVGKRKQYRSGQIWRERDRLVFLAGAGDPADAFDDGPQGDSETVEKAWPAGDPAGPAEYTIHPPEKMEVSLPEGRICSEVLAEPPEDPSVSPASEAFLDARFIEYPLLIRKWKAGDRFIPLGMARPKKLSDFLTDEKVPAHRKHAVYVVLSGNRIVWVAGHRIAHDVRIRPDTTKTIHLSYHRA